MALRRQVRLNSLVHDCDKRYHVLQRDVRRGAYTIDFVFLETCVTPPDLLLVGQPISVVRPQAGVENPLLKAEVALCQVIGKGLSLRCLGMPRKMRDAGYDSRAPMSDDLCRLIRKHLSRHPQPALIFIGESGADLK